jgi:hypothetical protein
MNENQRLLQQQRHRSNEDDEVDEEYDQRETPSTTTNYGATSTQIQRESRYQQVVKPVGLSWHNLTVVHPKSGRLILGKSTSKIHKKLILR